MLRFHENSSNHLQKITCLFVIKNGFLNTSWTYTAMHTWKPDFPGGRKQRANCCQLMQISPNIHFLEVLICEKYDYDWWHFSADILIELFTKHTELVATVANPKIGWRWTSTKLSIQIWVSLGICQAFDSQGYGRLSCSKNWKPIHLFRYQKNSRNTWISLKVKAKERKHVEKGQAQIGEVQS